MIESARIGARLSTLFFPIDLHDLVAEVTRLGFSVLGPVPPRPTALAHSTGTANPFAARGDMVIDINTDRKIIGVSGLPLPNLVASYREVMGIGDLRGFVDFHEFTSRLRVDSEKNAYQSIASAFYKESVVENLRKQVGRELSVWGFRLGDPQNAPQSREYVEIHVEPSTLRPEKVVLCSIILRSPDMEKVLGECEDYLARAEQAIATLVS